ncbi:Dabb family protein [Oryzibacter oryziterrae]|uniref:Dabb family protein n=1 Tax=Oryzibacter oryziterrae TaxID=2766474 RepID=UPI001F3DD5AD|nr:Dabb family protein [Oryzibacter oryziterrae]
MLRHIVFFSVKQGEDREAVHDGLKLLEANPHAEHVEIGTNLKQDSLGNDVDFIVYAEFSDADALASYKAHPSYQASIDRVRPLRELRIAADFLSPVEAHR